jgi:hypothetical protein
MNMHATDNLQLYPIPASLAGLLRRMDQEAQQVARLGRPVAATIVLSDGDYAIVDSVVRSMSGHRYSAATVRWNGRPLIPHAYAVAA